MAKEGCGQTWHQHHSCCYEQHLWSFGCKLDKDKLTELTETHKYLYKYYINKYSNNL